MAPAIAAVIAAIPALVQAGTGIAQQVKAGKLRNQGRPGYAIPESAELSLDVAKHLAGQRQLPGAPILEDRIRSSTGSGVQAIKEIGASGASRLGAVTDLYRGEQMAFQDLEVQNAAWHFGNQATLMDELNRMAFWENKKSEWEERMPYMQDMAAAAAMTGAGMQNVFGGTDNLSTNLINQGRHDDMMKRHDDMMKLFRNARDPIVAGEGGAGMDYEPNVYDDVIIEELQKQTGILA